MNYKRRIMVKARRQLRHRRQSTLIISNVFLYISRQKRLHTRTRLTPFKAVNILTGKPLPWHTLTPTVRNTYYPFLNPHISRRHR